ncbi:MAG: AraC family transcriptional regulator [Treponema sp.]|nr:AraC family transcriptional regulator [Treponema sp.]
MKSALHRPNTIERKHYIPSQKIAVSFHPHLLYAGTLRQTLKWQEERHSHNFLEILFIKSGSGVVIFGGRQEERSLEVKRGDIVIYNPNVSHYERSSTGDPLEMLFFGVRNIRLVGLPENHLISEGLSEVFHTNGQYEFFERIFSSLVSEIESDQIFSRELSESFTRMILIMILRLVSKDDDKYLKNNESFFKAKAYMDQHYLQIESLESLCNEVFISKFYLTHLFKKYLGKTPLQYIIQKKLDLAKMFLVESDMTIKDIAARCGYEDPNYFCKLFKKHEGITAMNYRKKTDAPEKKPPYMAKMYHRQH